MPGLEELLKRFKRSLNRDAEVREAIARCIKEVVSLDVRLEDISVKGGIVRIKTTPAKKNAVKLQETRLLEKVRMETGLNLKNIIY